MSPRTVHLSELLDDMASEPVEVDVVVRDLTVDSRAVTPGCLFIALPGLTHDAVKFVPDALAAGAAAVVYDSASVAPESGDVPAVAVTNLNERYGDIADRFFAAPTAAMNVVAITGTNGKTTCAWLLAGALENLGRRCGVIGTLGAGFRETLDGASLTTPDAVTLQRAFANLRDKGADSVAVEISSHALDQHRAQGVRAHVAVFTNLSQDHLDYHHTMQAYGEAKSRLFDMPGVRHAVVNTHDNFGRELAARISERSDAIALVRFGRGDAEVAIKQVDAHAAGISVTLEHAGENVVIQSPLIGAFNAENVAAVFAVLCALGIESSDGVRAIESAQAAPGRMERFVSASGDVTAIVDFAHTPDALEKALDAARQHTRSALWCVFGCGGDRDKAKRPLMGRAAAARADRVVITNDNPRGEDPQAIADAIRDGMNVDPLVLLDRPEAISHAISRANPGDVVLVAGKGHETTQTTGDRHIYMSDREMVRDALEVAA